MKVELELADLRGNPVYFYTANGKQVEIIQWVRLGGGCDVYDGCTRLLSNVPFLTAQLKALEILGVIE